jgi:hypothetical protein
MARWREREEDVLSSDELTELQRQLAHLTQPAVEDLYRHAHHKCSFQPYRLTTPRSIRELVQAWKLFRKWRK